MPTSFSMMGAWRKAGAIMALASEKPRSVGNAERGFFFGERACEKMRRGRKKRPQIASRALSAASR